MMRNDMTQVAGPNCTSRIPVPLGYLQLRRRRFAARGYNFRGSVKLNFRGSREVSHFS